MLCKSRRSSIALILLFFFIFSIACCLPVGMAENLPSAGGGGGGGTLAIPILSITPEFITVPCDGTIPITIYDNQTDLWTDSELLALNLYNTGADGDPVGPSIGSWLSANGDFSVTDSALTIEFNHLPSLQSGIYAFIVAEGPLTILGVARFTVEGDITTPVTLTATPDHGIAGETISIILAEPIDNDLWSSQDLVMPRLVTPANSTEGATPVPDAYFDNVIVSDNSIRTNLNLPATVAPGQYVIEVLLDQAVIGTAFFEVDDNAFLPSLFTLTPNKIYKGDLLYFEFSLPEGVTVNNPYAVLGSPDTGWHSSYPEKVSYSKGTYRVSFYQWELDGKPSGEYYVGIYEGWPTGGVGPLAAGKFDFVQLPGLNIDPDQILMPYPSGQVVSLEEPGDESIWSQGDELTLKIFHEDCEQGILILKEVSSLNPIQLRDDAIDFILPDGLDEDWYQVRVYRGEERIAISNLFIHFPWLDIKPSSVPAYFRESPEIELYENQYDIWNATDTLEVRLFNVGLDGNEHILQASIPDNELNKTDDVIKFSLPATVNNGGCKVELFRENNLIGRDGFLIYSAWVRVEPRRLFTNAEDEDRTVRLHITDPDTWDVSEADRLRIDIYQNYMGESDGYNDSQYKLTVETADLTVNPDTISFVFPEPLEKGRYELALQRKISADFWRTVAWGEFAYTDPPVKLQLTGDISGDPPTVKEGYNNSLNFILTDTAGTAWSAGESLNLDLFQYDPINGRWDWYGDLQPFGVVVGEDSISAKLPVGIRAGDYTITVSRANEYDEFALAQFRVLPFIELESVNLPPAQVNQPYVGTVKVTGGTAPYYWNIYSGPPEYRWPMGLDYYTNQNDSSQLIITGTFTEPGVYPLEIRVEDNDDRVSYHPIQLVVREGMPRVIAGNAAGLPGREVIVPIIGENLMGTGVSGIQFTLNYDPTMVTIVDNGVLPGMISDATIQSNIDNVNGQAIISIAWTQPLAEQVSLAEFCRVKFQINSNTANATCTVYLNDVDGTILSHGEYDIPAEAINGSIRATSYGDVNGNGKADVGDAVLILRHSAGIIDLPPALIEVANVDASTDGVVGPADAILVLKKVVRLIDKFPVEQ